MGRICEKAWLALKWSWAKDRPGVRPEVGFLSKDACEADRIAEIELGERFEWARNLVGEAENGADNGDVERGMTGLEGLGSLREATEGVIEAENGAFRGSGMVCKHGHQSF